MGHHLIYRSLVAAAICLPAVTNAVAQDEKPPLSEQIDDARRDLQDMVRKANRSLDSLFADDEGTLLISELGADAMGARELIGARVRSADGKASATVKDLVVDANGFLRVIVLAKGGVLGFGEEQVPLSAANLAVYRSTEGRIELRTAMTEAELASAGGTVYVIRSQIADDTETDLLLASSMLGADAINQNGVTIAKLHDVIFDRRQNVTHVVLSVGGFLGVGDKLVAAPIESLTIRRTREGLKLTVIASKETLEGLPAFQYP